MRTKARLALMASLALLIGALPYGSASAAPVTYEIIAGRYVFFPWAQSVRMLPSDLTVHAGDVLHFTSDVTNTITLLPADSPADEWLSESYTGGGKMWSLYMLDDGGAVKLNNRVIAPSRPCGWPSQSPCEFDAVDDDDGVLNSGLPFFDDGSGVPELRKIDFTVEVTAEPGASFDVVSLTTPRTRMTVNVVDDATAASDPSTLEAEAEATLVSDSAEIVALDKQLTSQKPSVRKGKTRVWKVKAGVDTETFTLRRFYPRRSTVRPGDSIRWTFTQSIDEAYTVSFPRAKALEVGESFPVIECNIAVNGDPLGELGPSLDEPAQLDRPPYCADPQSTEFQLPTQMQEPFGDGKIARKNDQESSGIRGAAVGFTSTYQIRFSPKAAGLKLSYIDIVHVLAGSPARGLVVVARSKGHS